MIVSRDRRAIITEIQPEKNPILNEQLSYFDQSELDLILVEGFKTEKFPKIELHRPSLAKPRLYPNDPDIIAFASDCPLELPDYLVKLDINHPQMIADFILSHFLGLV
jgi:molybdopterin-guanine dinucleotide biosynthesis protein B